MSRDPSGIAYSASSHLRMRMLRDRLARVFVALGGLSVIAAILLIFFYLFYIVAPMLESPEMHGVASYDAAVDSPVLYMAMEEQAEIGTLFLQDGSVRFFSTADGALVREEHLPIPAGVEIVSFSAARPTSGVVVLGLSNGKALVVRHRYQVSFPDDKRLITPGLEYPLGQEAIELVEDDARLLRVAVQEDEGFTIAGWSDSGLISLLRARPAESLLAEEGEWEFERSSGFTELVDIRALLIDPPQQNLYVVTRDGVLVWFDITDLSATHLMERVQLVPHTARVRDAVLLTGGASIMVASDEGTVSQWFSVRGEQGTPHLQKIRSFDNVGEVQELVPEFSRKGFMVADHDGTVGVYHATAHQLLMRERVTDAGLQRLAIAPRSNAFLALDDGGKLHFWDLHNEYPEISLSSLWGKVWYEGYDKPEYIWQSSSADNDFEPKLSLTPLTFGTLKAAFYAMIFAIPLSILGAIFTAYFMAPKMRQVVKPTIEIMEALPTVILGFLAGLWLAPLIEGYLPGVFTLLLLLPLMTLLASWGWHHLPTAVRARIPDGWEAALLIPVIIGTALLAFWISPLLELWLFGGDMPHWLSSEMGIGYDQRNSLVVGMAMGFAVIPTIFSITEDAIFSVPRHLTSGSLALGATPWQTLVRVVLLTASPGIFSAVMMGVGRAVGETMIVLMATGNTPVMDFSIFQGMRTLSANIAVEMPESEVGSTHYRVLFLAALVLFVFTFLFNTGAEVIRHRLRKKYGSL